MKDANEDQDNEASTSKERWLSTSNGCLSIRIRGE
jgi:hypothetical protein